MKRIIYIALLALSSLSIFSSCTEEEVSPKKDADTTSAGGGVQERLKD